MATPATKSIAALDPVTPVAGDSVLITDASDSDDIKRSLISLLGAAMGLSSMAEQASDSVAVTGGTESGVVYTNVDINSGAIDGTTVGATTPSTGAFTSITATLDATITGTLTATNLVGDGSGISNVTGSTNWEGAWLTATAYVVADIVENDGAAYIATADHTSGASTEPGTGASWATVWDLFAQGTQGIQGDAGPAGTSADTRDIWLFG